MKVRGIFRSPASLFIKISADCAGTNTSGPYIVPKPCSLMNPSLQTTVYLPSGTGTLAISLREFNIT